jgi:hypothetical protein
MGRPISRALDDGLTAEITRVCVLEGYKNANSMLYGTMLRIAKAMGYKRVITYILPEESGASMRAVGFKYDGLTDNKKTRNTHGRPRKTPLKYPEGIKERWVMNI